MSTCETKKKKEDVRLYILFFCRLFTHPSIPVPPEVQNALMVLPLKSTLSMKVLMIVGAVYHHTGKPITTVSYWLTSHDSTIGGLNSLSFISIVDLDSLSI